MSSLVADTHAAIWYYAGSPNLSPAAKAAMDGAIQRGDRIVLALISLVEVTYLIEKGRLPAVTADLLDQALADPASRLTLGPLDLPVALALRAIPRGLVPDMPDRIIAATALHLSLPLATADRKIQAAGVVPVVW